MEQMTQELNIENHNLKSVKKLYNDSSNSNIFLNTYTLLDVEDGKKYLFAYLLKRYNYKNPEYIQDFVEKSSMLLAKQLFSTSPMQSQQCVGSELVVTERADAPVYHENHRIVNIDSCYRENLLSKNETYDSYSSSDMLIDLNDKLDNTISLELANVCVPFTFYNISEDQGNNYLYIYDTENGDDDEPIKITIDDGNYTTESIISSINTEIVEYDGDYPIDISFSINSLTNKVTITDTSGNWHSQSVGTNGYDIIFYNSGSDDASGHSFNDQNRVNNNLGWLLGFRNVDTENYNTISYTVNSQNDSAQISVTSEAVCHLPYTKYFIIVIDDMNKNQTNKGLVQIDNSKEHINKTTYYKNSEGFPNIDNSLNCLTTKNNFDSLVNSSGRTLTKNQLYSSLQINNYRASFNETNSKMTAELINNVFAVVPFETKSLQWGTSMFTSDKNRFKRKYNGPIDITKLNVKILDDKGNLLNLNGSDWSLSIISTHSYKK